MNVRKLPDALTGIRSTSNIPHRTDVGQSGPPTKMAILGMVKVFPDNSNFTARMTRELIFTSCRTLTDFDKLPPMSSCWIVQPQSFMIKDMMHEYIIDPVIPNKFLPEDKSMIPPAI